MDEIVDFVLQISLRILYLENMRRNVQHARSGILFECCITDGVQKVRFTDTRFTVHKQGVENGLARIGCDRNTGGTCQTVAFAFYKSIERQLVDKLRIQFLLRRLVALFLFGCDVYLRIGNLYLIHQTGGLAIDAVQHFGQQIGILFFQLLHVEMGGHLYPQTIILILQRHDGLKPLRIIERRNIILDNAQTFIPYLCESLLHF